MRAWLHLRREAAQRHLLVFDRVTDWSALRRLRPYRPDFGRERGECIDRFYIEKFLAANKESIRGQVAEIEGDQYTKLFGDGRVVHSDILDVNEQNTMRTITIDLAQTDSAPQDVFDCIICTQTLFLIYDYAAAVRSLYKMLRPSGVLLVTVPGICSNVRGNLLAGAGEDWWRFTARSAQRAFGDVFSDPDVVLNTYGNVLAATAFLHGLVQKELTPAELEYHDPDYEVIIGIKAMKRASRSVA